LRHIRHLDAAKTNNMRAEIRTDLDRTAVMLRLARARSAT